ncbi:hypothetical protein [Photorhabdus luminescens]|uniref:Uncharacterized protein n=1 Tax=Photorhabdus luminescens subsp. mexicana TaxID=2100167 RepID=A0A4R4INF8_PHOLU|nr:hypothetical protein [Photorhabdus luminescens]TDB42116.1 hypothetical protein C5468_25190 [Photorhabdus luminescens subsp. mexicana]
MTKRGVFFMLFIPYMNKRYFHDRNEETSLLGIIKDILYLMILLKERQRNLVPFTGLVNL